MIDIGDGGFISVIVAVLFGVINWIEKMLQVKITYLHAKTAAGRTITMETPKKKPEYEGQK